MLACCCSFVFMFVFNSLVIYTLRGLDKSLYYIQTIYIIYIYITILLQSDSLSICICFINVSHTHLRVLFNVDCTVQHCPVFFFLVGCFSLSSHSPEIYICFLPLLPSFSLLCPTCLSYSFVSDSVDHWFIKVSLSHRIKWKDLCN